MIYPELPHDVNSPTHPVSAMDYMSVEGLGCAVLPISGGITKAEAALA